VTLSTGDQPPEVPVPPYLASQEIRSATPGRLAAPATSDEVRQLQQQHWWIDGQRAAADLQMASLQSNLWEASLALPSSAAEAAN
jgi:hypothetical protein